MNSSQTLPFVEPQARRPESPDRASLFYTDLAALRPMQVLSGFEPFYLHGNRRVHMILGQVGAVLMACIEFLAIPILSILIFAALMIAEVGDRRRPDVHRPGELR
jgi:hypothetical protein